MITPQIKESEKLIVNDIESSNLSSEDKERFISMIRASEDCCNGMTPEQKIQGLSENSFQVNCTLARIMMMLKENKVTTWKDVAVKALNSWHLVVIIGIIAILLGFHPEIADIIQSFSH